MYTADSLQQKIRSTIPLSDVMQFEIIELKDSSIFVRAPLTPNVNIHGTGFAGSIYSLAVLTGWALCTHILEQLSLDTDLVVGRAEISYRAPVEGDFDCHCKATIEQREAFLQALREHGKGRLELDIAVGELPQAKLHATFVAIQRA